MQVFYFKLWLVHQKFLVKCFLTHLVLSTRQDVVYLIRAEGRRRFRMDLSWFNPGCFIWVELAQDRLLGPFFPAFLKKVVLLVVKICPQPLCTTLTFSSITNGGVFRQARIILDGLVENWSQALLARPDVGSEAWCLKLGKFGYVQGLPSSNIQRLMKFHGLHQMRWWTLPHNRPHLAQIFVVAASIIIFCDTHIAVWIGAAFLLGVVDVPNLRENLIGSSSHGAIVTLRTRNVELRPILASVSALTLAPLLQLLLLFHQSLILLSLLFLDVAVHELNYYFYQAFGLDSVMSVFVDEDLVGAVESRFSINYAITKQLLILWVIKIQGLIFVKDGLLLVRLGRWILGGHQRAPLRSKGDSGRAFGTTTRRRRAIARWLLTRLQPLSHGLLKICRSWLSQYGLLQSKPHTLFLTSRQIDDSIF